MQTISARANLQPLQDRTCFRFLKKKAKKVVLTREEEEDQGAGSTVLMQRDATVGREEQATVGFLRGRLKSREEEAWSDCDGTRDSKHRIIWQQAKTRTLKIHSFIIREVALYRDGGNGVT